METVENAPGPPPAFPTVPTAPTTTETMSPYLQNLTHTTLPQQEAKRMFRRFHKSSSKRYDAIRSGEERRWCSERRIASRPVSVDRRVLADRRQHPDRRGPENSS